MAKFYAVDHTLLSPSGHVSKRGLEAAKRAFVQGMLDIDPDMIYVLSCTRKPKDAATLKAEHIASLRHSAANLRDLAAHGMHVRKYPKVAAKLEAEADALEVQS